MLYKHIIQVENKNVGLKVGGHKHTIAPPVKKVGGGGTYPPCPPASYASAICTKRHNYFPAALVAHKYSTLCYPFKIKLRKYYQNLTHNLLIRFRA